MDHQAHDLIIHHKNIFINNIQDVQTKEQSSKFLNSKKIVLMSFVASWKYSRAQLSFII